MRVFVVVCGLGSCVEERSLPLGCTLLPAYETCQRHCIAPQEQETLYAVAECWSKVDSTGRPSSVPAPLTPGAASSYIKSWEL